MYLLYKQNLKNCKIVEFKEFPSYRLPDTVIIMKIYLNRCSRTRLDLRQQS